MLSFSISDQDENQYSSTVGFCDFHKDTAVWDIFGKSGGSEHILR